MKLTINEDLQIVNDTYGFILQERKTVTPAKPKDGVIPNPHDVWVNVGYYGKLEHALKGVLDYRLLRSTSETLAELRSEIDDLKRELGDILTLNT
jgi:hypothetical protein